MRLSKPLLRAGAGLLIGGGVLVATAAPAFAHANFGTLDSVKTNTEQNLTMEVPLEKGEEIRNVDVVIAIPAGWEPKACGAEPDWTCGIENGSGQYPKTVHFKSQNTLSPREHFEFTVHSTDKIGTFKFPTIQKYSDGTQSDWVGDAQSPNPAPILKTTQGPPITVPPTTNPDKPTTVPPTTKPGTPPTPAPPVTNPGGGPVPTTRSGVTTTAIPGAPTTNTTSTTAPPATDVGGSTSIPEETTIAPGSTVVAVTGTGTVPGTVAAANGSGSIDASARPAASPSGGNGPLIAAGGVLVLAALAGVLVFRKNLFGGADPAADGPEITPEPASAGPAPNEPPPPSAD